MHFRYNRQPAAAFGSLLETAAILNSRPTVHQFVQSNYPEDEGSKPLCNVAAYIYQSTRCLTQDNGILQLDLELYEGRTESHEQQFFVK